MNYTGPKIRLSRSLGIAITPKSAKFLEKRPDPPGMHGKRRKMNKLTDYGRQLKEKQRLRFQYNISERQMRNYYRKSDLIRGNTADTLIRKLESRLDALVLRGGLARTIFNARQLVTHGHICVNGRKVTIPSYPVKVADVISVAEKSRKLDAIKFALQNAGKVPYVKSNAESMTAEYLRLPNRDEVPVICQISLVVEYYSR